MDEIIKEIKRVKMYIIYCVVVFAVFIWSGVTGRKLMGDDNESKEAAVGNQANRFYHK